MEREATTRAFLRTLATTAMPASQGRPGDVNR
jgi:hypothetical protein